MVFLHRGAHWMACQSNLDLTALKEVSVHFHCPWFPQWEVVPEQHCANATEDQPGIRQEDDWFRLAAGHSHPPGRRLKALKIYWLLWLFYVTSVPQELYLMMKAVTVKGPLALCTNVEVQHAVTCVEAGSNTSTVTLQVVRGNEMRLKKAAP
jgi:hypothetical protein